MIFFLIISIFETSLHTDFGRKVLFGNSFKIEFKSKLQIQAPNTSLMTSSTKLLHSIVKIRIFDI